MYNMNVKIDKKGRIKGSFPIITRFITEGNIAKCGNSYHITIRKDVAEAIGSGKKIGVILFEQGIEVYE